MLTSQGSDSMAPKRVLTEVQSAGGQIFQFLVLKVTRIRLRICDQIKRNHSRELPGSWRSISSFRRNDGSFAMYPLFSLGIMCDEGSVARSINDV